MEATALRREQRVQQQIRRSSSSPSSSTPVQQTPSSSNSSNSLARAVEVGVNDSNMRTQQVSALRLMLEFGSVEEKAEAMEKIRTIALP